MLVFLMLILYPYLGANNLYGYADSEGNLVIEPQYTKAGFFQNNVAIVRLQGEKEKLIDMNNQEIPIPLNYDELIQHAFSKYTIIELTETYTNRWRFWEWQFLPDFSFFGTPSRNRLFDTEVMREQRSLYWLEGQRVIQSKRGTKGKQRTYFYLHSINDHTIQVDEAFYRLADQRSKRTVKNVLSRKIVNGNNYLQKKGRYLRIIDSDGKPVSTQKWQQPSEINVEVAGAHISFESVDFYTDNQGNKYVYPDFNKKFPQKISPYPFQDTLTTAEIMPRVQSFASIRESDRFLLVSDFGRKVFALDTAGNWQDPEESIGKITVVSRVGNILWPAYSDELGPIQLPDGWRVISFSSFNRSQDVFRVSLRNDEQSVLGIWDRNTSSWIMPPDYHWIGYRASHDRFVSFQAEKDGKWGLYDLVNQHVHIPPTYDYINDSGWVRLNENGASKEFYLDVENKKEFREKG